MVTVPTAARGMEGPRRQHGSKHTAVLAIDAPVNQRERGLAKRARFTSHSTSLSLAVELALAELQN